MTLATRCTTCGTIFRVVQDQLRVSQGWVRCGRCGEAFNAIESLVDLPPPRVPAPFALDPPAHPSPPTSGTAADPSPAAGTPPEMAVMPEAAPPPPAVEAAYDVPADAGPVHVVSPHHPSEREILSDAGPEVLVPPPPPAANAATPPARAPTPDEALALALERAAGADLAPPMSQAAPSADELDASAMQYVATDGAVIAVDDMSRTLPAGGPGEFLADLPVADPGPAHESTSATAQGSPSAQGVHTAPRSGANDVDMPEPGDVRWEDGANDLPARSRAPATDIRVEPSLGPVTSAPAVAADDPTLDAQAAVAPSFIVQADRAARWRRPGVRAALFLGVLLAATALVGQVAYVYRDRLAALFPASKPVLAQACGWLDCRISDVRLIDALSVESSGLVRVEGSPVYRLSITLRNRAPIEVAAPALDLSLTDVQGKPIARRVLTMADLDLPLRTLKPGSELPMQVPLGIGDRQVSGYTVEIFYP